MSQNCKDTKGNLKTKLIGKLTNLGKAQWKYQLGRAHNFTSKYPRGMNQQLLLKGLAS